jgi:hypothetical protein
VGVGGREVRGVPGQAATGCGAQEVDAGCEEVANGGVTCGEEWQA